MAEDTAKFMEVRDPDDDVRYLHPLELQRLIDAGDALICPNDEEDEAAGYHAHLHMRWEDFFNLGSEDDEEASHGQ